MTTIFEINEIYESDNQLFIITNKTKNYITFREVFDNDNVGGEIKKKLRERYGEEYFKYDNMEISSSCPYEEEKDEEEVEEDEEEKRKKERIKQLEDEILDNNNKIYLLLENERIKQLQLEQQKLPPPLPKTLPKIEEPPKLPKLPKYLPNGELTQKIIFEENDCFYRIEIIKKTKCFITFNYIYQDIPYELECCWSSTDFEKNELLEKLKLKEYKNRNGEIEEIEEHYSLGEYKRKIKRREVNGKILEWIEFKTDMEDYGEKIIHYFSF